MRREELSIMQDGSGQIRAQGLTFEDPLIIEQGACIVWSLSVCMNGSVGWKRQKKKKVANR
jgi:hypothetical protein